MVSSLKSSGPVQKLTGSREERINRTGCAGKRPEPFLVSLGTSRTGTQLTGAAENERLTDCFHETKDWRACTAEVRRARGLTKLPVDNSSYGLLAF